MIDVRTILFAVIFGLLAMLNMIPFFYPVGIGFGIIAGITILITLIVIIALFATKRIDKHAAAVSILSYFTIFIIVTFYVAPSFAVSVSQGPILNDNWYNSLVWINNNTKTCALVATYWDPGHFITGIANRSVIYDGASQNFVLELNLSDAASRGINASKYTEGINLEHYDNGIVQVVYKHGDNISTSRMKDVAISMFTSNESLAVELLRKYNKDGCD